MTKKRAYSTGLCEAIRIGEEDEVVVCGNQVYEHTALRQEMNARQLPRTHHPQCGAPSGLYKILKHSNDLHVDWTTRIMKQFPKLTLCQTRMELPHPDRSLTLHPPCLAAAVVLLLRACGPPLPPCRKTFFHCRLQMPVACPMRQTIRGGVP